MKPILKLVITASILLLVAGDSPYIFAQTKNTLEANVAVVAIVNNQPITLEQLEAVTAAQLRGVTDPEVQMRIKTQALNGLINRALVRQEIAKIDTKQNPDWESQLKTMQEQGADNLYMNTRIGKNPEVPPQVIEQIYRDNPDFYAKRHIYHYLQLVIPLSEKVSVDDVEKILKIGDSGFDAVKELLKNRGVPYGGTNNWLSAEEINPIVLSKLKTLIDGQTASEISSNKKDIFVIKSIGKYADPVTLEDARPAIAQKVLEARRNQLGSQVIDDLRVKAKVEINDPALAKHVNKEQAITKVEKPATSLAQVKVSWYFALLVLVPAALASFYRSPPLRKQGSRPFIARLFDINSSESKGSNTRNNLGKSIVQIAVEECSIVLRSRIIQFVLILLAAIWFWMPLVDFFNQTPRWATLQKLILLSAAGIGMGLAITLVCWKVPVLHRLFTNRWIAVALLFALCLLVFLA